MTSMIIQGETPDSVPHNRTNLVPEIRQQRAMNLDFDPETYTAFASYAPVYTPFKRDVFDLFDTHLARNVLAVADAIAQHAGPLGLCWALSLKRIMAIAHLRFDATKSGLLGLIEKDWIREIRTSLPGRRTPFFEWQLHPRDVLYVAQPYIVEAFEIWNTGVPVILKVSKSRESDLQSQYKPESESRTNQNQQNHNPIYQPREGQKNFQEIGIDECREPLKDYKDEEFAYYIKSEFKTHLSVARQLIKSYGRIEVENAASTIKQMMTQTEVRKPGGALRGELRRRLYAPSYQDAGR